jgi:Holliday junction resolvase RusA-like endonuclease
MIVLDLPAPLSVNRTRRIDWAAKPKIGRWIKAADVLVMSQGKLPRPIDGPFQITLTFPETSKLDLDNSIKGSIDYLRRLRLIADDDPMNMRRVVIEFGEAPSGCRVKIQSFSGGEQ